MNPGKVYAVYYSAVGHTKTVTETIAGKLAECFEVPFEAMSFTLPAEREKIGLKEFSPSDLVVFGVPAYAGRIPNKMLPFVQTMFRGKGTLALAVAAYGNRSVQDSLMELRNELEGHGFHTVAGAAVVTSHVMSPEVMAPGRPDEKDIADLKAFAEEAAAVIRAISEADLADGIFPDPVAVPGNDPVGPYYTPLQEDLKPAKFLKAKPKTDPEKCDHCGICAEVCPLGSIDHQDITQTPGICIKCQACIRKCPRQAKYFDDPSLLSHIAMLESNYADRKESQFFL